MEFDNITSPPNPTLSATSTTLYRVLHSLRLWVIEQIAILRDEVPPAQAAQLTEPALLPNEAVWEIVSVTDKYTALMYARRIREAWDAILREHETDWGGRVCLKKRYYLIQSACHVLSEAFVDPETREARFEKSAGDMAKTMEVLRKHLRNVLLPPELREEADKVQNEEHNPEEDQW